MIIKDKIGHRKLPFHMMWLYWLQNQMLCLENCLELLSIYFHGPLALPTQQISAFYLWHDAVPSWDLLKNLSLIIIFLQDSSYLGLRLWKTVPKFHLYFQGEDKINVARYHEIGRAVATIMSDEVFHDVAYKAKRREHLLAGMIIFQIFIVR